MSDEAAESIITEHLDYSALSVIDDVINAVNEIVYKCVNAMETYLKAKEEKKQEEQEDDDIIMTDPSQTDIMSRIQHGSGAMETLLTAAVDRNFDLFELYVLRNIFSIPKDLVDGGWMRLEHHEDIKPVGENFSTVNQKIRALTIQTQFLSELKKLMSRQLHEISQLQAKLKGYKLIMMYFQKKAGEHRELEPLRDSLPFLISETKKRIGQFEKLHLIISNGDMALEETYNEKFLKRLTDKQLESLGLSNKDMPNKQPEIDHEEELLAMYSDKDEADLKNLPKWDKS
ncbi:unnamed protein product [Kuraishia capsulata CBS 1993]|uniref:Mis12 domain-containing protein n=1 Tax=Kuraishia capsulata CBS 1993 TaxID=1382522 RepID=W6MGA3_9ASCO|nr:uncharacterized protein KUCA_T00001031001 [Kuraishia capsulata CBS 1993]CDK25064.1 unnamed protein product [Kuraishia capsulata CBS 1993]